MVRRLIARVLLALAGGLLIAGLARGSGAARNRIPLLFRMCSSALVLLAALIMARPSGQIGRLSAAGMACGLLGDLIMAKVIPLPEHVIGGMAAFGVGHGLYMRAASLHGAALGLSSRRAGVAGLLAGWLAALVGWRALAYSPERGALINRAALGYALLLGSMAGLAGALAVQDRRHTPLAAGSALFLLSDLILASELFRGTSFPLIGDLVWLTYLGGQALIVDSLSCRTDALGSDASSC